MTTTRRKTLVLVQTALLCAIVAVLQLFLANIRIGIVTLSFTLVPIVVSAVLINPVSGMIVGLFSGLQTFIQVLTSGDVFYVFLMANSPVATFFISSLKTSLAGLVAGLVFRTVLKNSKHMPVRVILPSIVCPVVNTGLFCLGMYFIFGSALMNDATFGPLVDGKLFAFVFIVLPGINFVFEVILNLVVCPVLITALSKTRFFNSVKK